MYYGLTKFKFSLYTGLWHSCNMFEPAIWFVVLSEATRNAIGKNITVDYQARPLSLTHLTKIKIKIKNLCNATKKSTK